MTDLETCAGGELEFAFGPGAPAASGEAPGRITLLGEHVDYVGGRIACMAIDLTLAVSVRPSGDGRWRAVSEGRRVERDLPSMAGDIGDRVFAAASALRRLEDHPASARHRDREPGSALGRAELVGGADGRQPGGHAPPRRSPVEL